MTDAKGATAPGFHPHGNDLAWRINPVRWREIAQFLRLASEDANPHDAGAFMVAAMGIEAFAVSLESKSHSQRLRRFGLQLRSQRSGSTQGQFGDLIGCSASTISGLERGVLDPGLDLQRKISDKLGPHILQELRESADG